MERPGLCTVTMYPDSATAFCSAIASMLTWVGKREQDLVDCAHAASDLIGSCLARRAALKDS